MRKIVHTGSRKSMGERNGQSYTRIGSKSAANDIHIAFINIIKSLCVAAILNSTVFFISCFAFFLSFSLPLPIRTSYVRLCCAAAAAAAVCVVVLCFFFSYHCITKATLPLLMFRIPMFFFSPLFQSVSLFFSFYFTTLPATRDVCVYKCDMLL